MAGDGSGLMVSEAPTDVELHDGVVAGDEDALAALYDRFGTFLQTVAHRATCDRDAACDVVQEVFAHLWEHPLAFDPTRGAMRGWLATIAHRRAVDWVRKEERQRRVGRDHAVDLAPPPIRPGADAELEASETILEVRRAVSALPAPAREAVELAFYRGLTYRQVAVKLGIPEGTAKSRMRAALRQLTNRLAERGTG
jgi:RNA polymerase sigma-70 factor (ECF subfamily)